MGENLGAFLAHPRLQHLSAYLETPGPDRQGVTAADIQTLRELHARWRLTASDAAQRSRLTLKVRDKSSTGGVQHVR